GGNTVISNCKSSITVGKSSITVGKSSIAVGKSKKIKKGQYKVKSDIQLRTRLACGKNKWNLV
uniref:Uncharacterized protein n=1 Tax=Esox lucius TaxID=8010 RepID=A0AAY5K0G3_ESOLU